MATLQPLPLLTLPKMSQTEFRDWLAQQTVEVQRTTFLLEDGTVAQRPYIEEGAYVHPTACLIGGVLVRKGCFIGPFAVIRTDEKPTIQPLVIDEDSNIQDCAVVHSTTVRIGRRVIVAHQAVVHGAEVQDGAALYIQAVADTGSIIAEGCFLHQGSYVGKGIRLAPNRLVPAGTKVLTQAQADSLPEVPEDIRQTMKNVLKHNISHAKMYLSFKL